MIKLNYDPQSGDILGFYPYEINYKEVPLPNIEITKEQWQFCINNSGKVCVNVETLEISEKIESQEELSRENQLAINNEARIFLQSTDWKVLRHRDQLDLRIQTSLTNEEFQNLLLQRQKARIKVMEIL